MREIKFRVWNGEQMVSPDYIARDGRAYWRENSIPTSSDKLMQYTGLKDSKGKEIYESDIVEYYVGGEKDTVEGTAEVVYEDGSFMLDEWWISIFNGDTDLEVIGNIYENPELLK